jgi:hypothetical protein
MNRMNNENVITIEECRKRAQEASFGAIMKLEASAKLRLVGDDELIDFKEVSVKPVDCKWNTQPASTGSRKMAYILVCLPFLLSLAYLILTRFRRG